MKTPTSQDPLALFHPAVANWFRCSFPSVTPAQAGAWPLIRLGRSTLVAAPTGSGKTLTAFLAALDELVQRSLEPDGLPDETAVLYISPLKALSNDIHLNLERPLSGICNELQRLGLPVPTIRTAVRTGGYASGRTRGDAQAGAACAGDHAGVLLCAAWFGIGAADAGERTQRDRRRDTCAGRQQAWQPSGAFAGAARGALWARAGSGRAVRDAKSPSARWRIFWSAGDATANSSISATPGLETWRWRCRRFRWRR